LSEHLGPRDESEYFGILSKFRLDLLSHDARMPQCINEYY
jgi:hypothetical protein